MKPEDYVTYPTAKLLKAAGYPQGASLWSYLADGKMVCTYDESGCCCDAPHLYDAMKWLREEKQIYVGINKWTETESVNVGVWKTRSFSYYMPTLCTLSFSKWLTQCETYEAACDAGIAAACEWLIAHGTNDESKTE